MNNGSEITSAFLARLTKEVKAVLGLFVIGGESGNVGDVRRELTWKYGFPVSAKACDEACRKLVAAGIMKCTASYATLESRRYELARELEPEELRRIFAEMSALGMSGKNSSQTGMFLALLNGGGGFRLVEDRYSYHDDDALWSVLIRFASLFSDSAEVPSLCLPDGTKFKVYRILASVMFCLGVDVTSLLSDWHRKMMRAKADDDRLYGNYDLFEYAAYCVWTGHADRLDALDGKTDDEGVNAFVEGCRALFKGDLKSAYRNITSVSSFVPRSAYEREAAILSMPASYLLSLAVTSFWKPALSKMSRLAANLCPRDPNFRYDIARGSRGYFTRRMNCSPALATLSFGFSSCDTFDKERCLSPVCSSGEIFSVLLTHAERDASKEQTAMMIEMAEKALRTGCPTLAGMYLSVFGWKAPEEMKERVDSLVKAVDTGSGVWFRSYDSGSDIWKLVVEAFDRCLPALKKGGAKSAGGAKSGRIVWRIEVWAYDFIKGCKDICCDIENAGNSVILFCNGLTPFFRGPRSPDDGSADRKISEKALLGGKYDAIFTEHDKAVADEIRKEISLHYCSELKGSVIARLCGDEGVVLRSYSYETKKDLLTPVKIVRRDVPLAMKSTDDGGIAVSIEKWCRHVKADYALRVAGPGQLAFYEFSKALRALIEVFDAYGEKGEIKIPKAGMDAMRPILPRMAALAPIQGDFSDVATGEGLERVTGDSRALVRLESAGEILSLSLRVKPLEKSDLVFVPGAGQPERIVSYERKTAVLVRDLAAEKAAAAKVRDALEDFGSWSDGDDDWKIDSPLHALKALAALKDLGADVRTEWRKGRRLAIAAPQAGSWKLSATPGAEHWFSVRGEFKLDDGKAMTISDLIDAFRNRQGEFIPFGDGEYVRLTSALLKRIEALESAGRVKRGALEVPPAAIMMLNGAFSGGEAEGAMALPASMAERAEAVREAFAEDVAVPPRLKATLRPYQVEGFEWLSRLASCGLGACLADDMGLGKTLQIIAVLLARSADGPSLVVAPASVCGNWRSEIARFAPTLRTVMAWDEKADGMERVNAAGPGDVVIAGYSLLVSREEKFVSKDWNGVVLDEAQAVKNETSKRAKSVRLLRAKFRIAATGTPVENRLTELWSISEFLNPGLLGPVGDFVRRFTLDGRATPQLKRLVSPLVLRRVKRDVVEDLPEKTEITIPVELGEEERAGYETCRLKALDTLAAGAKENRISILAELTRLRRYCCHPSLVTGVGDAESAKMTALVELLANLRENNHRALVFSQFTDYLALVRKTIDASGWSHLYLDGQTPAAERARLVDEFQRGKGDFFVISLKAGGTGLNLTAANYVILLDPWWNPAVENQAADRVHRIGQKNPVTVYRLIAADTVEERVLDLHQEKKAIADDMLDATASSALTPDELMKLFG